MVPEVELENWRVIRTIDKVKQMYRYLSDISAKWADECTPRDLFRRISRAKTSTGRGNIFEYITKVYFEAIGERYDMWEDIDTHTKYGLQGSATDMGIDGVWWANNSKPIAVQCKYRSTQKSVPWRELSTFIGSTFGVANGVYDKALIITTAEKKTKLLDMHAKDNVEFWTLDVFVRKCSDVWSDMKLIHLGWVEQLEDEINKYEKFMEQPGSIRDLFRRSRQVKRPQSNNMCE